MKAREEREESAVPASVALLLTDWLEAKMTVLAAEVQPFVKAMCSPT